jgi:hypothetical protein
VISAPIYNFGEPASLNVWIDQIAGARLSFRYTGEGAEGLLGGKKVYILTATGGTEVGSAIDFADTWLRFVLAFSASWTSRSSPPTAGRSVARPRATRPWCASTPPRARLAGPGRGLKASHSYTKGAAMIPRAIRQRIPALEVTEGAGVTVHRSIGTPALRNLDPFLMLDHFGSDNPGEYIAGFPEHPHRGFITLTYMLDGHMEHRDSMGNRGDLKAGGAQWMKAASGVIHSEMPKQADGLMRGFQLWINLPASEKMSDPVYQEFSPGAIPEVAEPGSRVRVLAGEYAGTRGVVEDPATDVLYLDVALDAGASFRLPIPADRNAFVYVFEGGARVAGDVLPRHTLVVLGDGDTAEIEADRGGARLILVAGRPLGEPVVQYGPFVMNSREEIEQAFADYRDGRLVRAKAAMTGR